MKIKPIRDEVDYRESINLINSIFNENMTQHESDQVEVLSILIEDWENKNYPPEVDNKLIYPEIGSGIDYIYELVKNVSENDNSSIIAKGLKLNEEVGELSAELLKISRDKYTTDSIDEATKHALIECADCLIMIFVIMIKLGFEKEQIIESAEKQIKKWLDYIK